jgi:PAS domain S-box-containing protein
MVEISGLLLATSILLRLFGVVFSLLLLYRIRDYRFAFLTFLLSLMALRQLFTLFGFAPGLAEFPGLVVSVLSVIVVYYLLQYTRQERAQKATLEDTNRRLRENRNRLEATIATSPDDVFVFDSDGRLREIFSEETEELTDDAVGVSIHELRPDSVAEAIDSVIETTLQTGERSEVEYSLRRDGEMFWYEARTARLQTPDDDDRVLFVRRDITDRKTREQELRRFQQAVEAAGAAIYITDRDETIRYVNPAFEEVTGYREADILGKTPGILSSEVHDERYYDRLWSTILDGETWREEIVNERRSGERYHANQTIAPVFDDGGKIDEFVAIQIEITERKRRERQLRVLDRLLRHNLRNGMTVILGHAGTLESKTDGELARSAALIRERGESLLAKADTEREIVRLVTEPQHRTSVDLAEVLEEQAETARQNWSDATIDLDAPETLVVMAIPDLPAAIGELIENAIKHSGDAPEVRITVEIDADTVSVRIADDGPGIPEQEQQILFGNLEIDALHHGTGMGLWFVYWVIQLSGGRIKIEEGNALANTVAVVLQRPSD